MTNEKQTRKSTPTAEKSGANIMAGIGMIALIMAIIWAAWKFGLVVFSRMPPAQATDRLGICIIVAAILHAHFTTTRRK